MSCMTSPDAEACPCGIPEFPVVVCNPANQPAIAYRVGDYLAFRDRLLRPLPGETQLVEWRPGATGDLAVQMVEWWAYLADVLTFYNERIANEAYLGTALQPESVNHLVQMLGYRPRPALGARVNLAGLLSSAARTPVALPHGLQVQSKPAPGAPPQVFELDKDCQLTRPDVVPAEVVAKSRPLQRAPGSPGAANTVWLAGKVGTLKTGDVLLLINAQALGPSPAVDDYAWISVTGTQAATDPLGNPVTAVSFAPIASTLVADAAAENYVLLKSAQSSPLWSFPTSTPSLVTSKFALVSAPGEQIIIAPRATTSVRLAGLARALARGALFLLDAPGATGLPPTPRIVSGYAEQFWYANCGADAPADTLPTSNVPPPVGIPISIITADGVATAWSDTANAASVIVRYGFTRVGDLVPVQSAADLAYPGGGTTLAPTDPRDSFPAQEVSVLIEDTAGAAALGALSPLTSGWALCLPPTAPATIFASPMEVFFNLLPFSRGKSVPLEVLGSGSPLIAGQSFVLKNAPVTYFADPAAISGDSFSSTVQVAVNNVLWQEVQSFYGQPANGKVFVLGEDDEGRTRVTFGDGIYGALLPSGTDNVVAAYRYGAGAGTPAPETLTVVQTPQPGLKSIRNPVAPTGGTDADDPGRLRTLGPRSVLTFGRAVSADDYAAMALIAGAGKAAAAYAFDPVSQRPKITLWVAGDAGVIAAVKLAVTGAAMPGQGLVILDAMPTQVSLTLDFVCASALVAPAITNALTTALTDPDAGLFGTRVIGIGQAVFDSQIEAACLAVPGVQAVHGLNLDAGGGAAFSTLGSLLRRFNPGLRPKAGCSGRRHDPGAGRYFALASLTLNPAPVAAT